MMMEAKTEMMEFFVVDLNRKKQYALKKKQKCKKEYLFRTCVAHKEVSNLY